jgi:1-acyl-sn-glycerol-3-phosphate acyltransferase
VGLWGKGLARIMGIRIHPRNERQGTMGDVIIANHMGFMDIPILLTFYPSVFIIKMEMRRVFYFGKALERQGHVFVERGSESSRRSAREGVRRVLEQGDRIIVFPEGRASPDAERRPFKPFCFFEAARQGKRVEACVIDYLPDRQMLAWDPDRPMMPQLVELVGRPRIDVSVEFLPSEVPDDPEEAARRYHDVIQERLERHDREREREEARGEGGSPT